MSMMKPEELIAVVETTRKNLINVFDSFEHIWVSKRTSEALVDCLATLNKFQRSLEEDVLMASVDEVLDVEEGVLLNLRLIDE